MPRRLPWAGILALAACVSHERWFFTADVRGAGRPLGDALVILSCETSRYARRTDESGRARLSVPRAAPRRCAVLAASTGFATVELRDVMLEERADAAPVPIELAPLRAVEVP